MFFLRSERVYPAIELVEKPIRLDSWHKASRYDQDFRELPHDLVLSLVFTNYAMALSFSKGLGLPETARREDAFRQLPDAGYGKTA